MRKDPFENRWRKKVFLLAGVAVILALCIFALAYKGSADRRAYEATLSKQGEIQKGKGAEETKGTDAMEKGVDDKETIARKSGVKTEPDYEIQKNDPGINEEGNGQGIGGDTGQTALNMRQGETAICIQNLEEYAKAVMGENAELLEQALVSFVKERHLDVTEAVIFHVMVPMSDPQSIHYYVRLEDGKGTLVLLAYHPRENLVTASACNYTEAEVMEEIWENNGPVQRDITPEEEAAFQQGEEQKEETQNGDQTGQEHLSGDPKPEEGAAQGVQDPVMETGNKKGEQDGAFGKN